MPSTSMPDRASSSPGLRHLLAFVVLVMTIALGLVTGHAAPSSAPGTAVQQGTTSLAPIAADAPLSGCAFDGHGQHTDEASGCVVAVPAAIHGAGDRPLPHVTPRTTTVSTVAVGELGRRDGSPVSLTELSISRT